MEGDLVIDEENVGDPLYTVSDKKLAVKARLTLPELLRVAPSSDPSQTAVYANRPLPYKTQFGPVDAPLVEFSSLLPGSFQLKSKVKIHRNEFYQNEPSYLFYNTSDENLCNWMCLVRPACNFDEQNLIAHFVKDEIYFTTTRTIENNEELKVWYAPKYAQYMGKAPLLPIPKQTSLYNEATKITDRSSSMHRTNVHPNVSSLDADASLHERSIPPKKRGWNRTNPNLNKVNEQNILLSQSWTQDIINTVPIPQNEHFKTKELSKPPSSTNPGYDGLSQSNSNPKKLHPCPECGKVFAKKFTLKMHRTIHSNKFDFLCHACGKGFKRKDKLHDHIKRVHLTSKPRPKVLSSTSRFVPRVHPKDCEKFLYKCLRCSLGFQRRGMLINHFTKKHPDVDISTIPELMLPVYKDEVSFSCLYCDKTYKSNHKRICHISKHHPGRKLPLDIRESKKLGEDRNDISKKGSFLVDLCHCPHCPSQYSSKAKLLKHIESKHVKDSTRDHPAVINGVVSSEPPSVDFSTQITSNSEVRNHVTSEVLKPTNQSKAYTVPNSIFYNNVDNSIQIWGNRDCSSLAPVSEVMSFSKQGETPQDIHHVIMNTSEALSSQISPTYFSIHSDIPLIDDTMHMSHIEENNKIQNMLELNNEGAFPPPRSNYVSHQPNMEYVAQMPAVNIPDSAEADKTISNTCEKNSSAQQSNANQRFSKPLPPTYSRGRKQFLLQFCGDSIINGNYEPQQQFPTTVSSKPPPQYEIESQVSGGTPLDSNQHRPDIQVPTYTSTNSRSKDISVEMTALPYSDDLNSWMFNS